MPGWWRIPSGGLPHFAPYPFILLNLPHFDPYPFILLNLVFSALAAYAAPFILLADTRRSDRDRARAQAEERHHEELERRPQELLEQDNSQTRQIARLLEQDTAQTEDSPRCSSR